MTRKYVVRTYGCQMNEHDSERIAGLFDADGMDQASSEEDADVIVLNTPDEEDNRYILVKN